MLGNVHNRISQRCRHAAFASWVVAVILCLSVWTAYAQGSVTRYVYDDNGRLRAVIAPSGEANIYEYDAAGNITAIRRNTATTMEVLDFYPREGAPGTQVTIIGTGFGGGVNAVAFNGAAAQIVSVNAPLVVVTVPEGATTGPITVTTAGGTVTTALPFTVRGISVTPASATVLSRREIQFTATVVESGTQNVVWSVNGIEGGSSTVGTITSAGLYVSPNLLATQAVAAFRVRATSVNDVSLFGEAVVTVRNPEFFRTSYTEVVSVLNGNPLRAYSAPLSVLNGNSLKAYSAPLSVLNGNPLSAYSAPLSVLNGNPLSAYSAPLSVLNGNLTDAFTPVVSVLNGNPTVFRSSIVSVTTGPGITAISPAQVARGVTTPITITGENLGGATELIFLDAATGAVATGITATGISVNGAGTSLTASLNVSAGISPIRYAVIVVTPTDSSPPGDAGSNVIEVLP
jgi:YD repeat-containing protein